MSDVVTEREGPVLRIQINRPEKKNALTAAMYEAMASGLRDADAERGVRAVLIHGAGDVFTAGNDLRDFLDRPPQSADSPVVRFMGALAGAAKPVVAAVHGSAVGIGTTLLLHCDLVYATEATRFHMPFVDLGLVPEFGSSVLWPALAGHRRAAEYLLLGKPFDGRTAAAVGLVTATVPADRLLAEAVSAARALAEKPPAAVRLTKMLMKRGVGPALEAAIREESHLFAERLVSAEAKEAFAAFLEKRRPDFSSCE
jgi:enoyl-CoA hydratase/carnithine racemase